MVTLHLRRGHAERGEQSRVIADARLELGDDRVHVGLDHVGDPLRLDRGEPDDNELEAIV